MTTAEALPDALRRVIEADAKEAEAQGNMTTRVCDALRDAGAFRLLTPHEFGGWETSFTSALSIYEAFGRIDASVGALVWNLNMGFIAAMLPHSGARRILDADTEPILANSGAPGVAERVDGGLRLSGRWPIMSGVDFADWVVLIVMVEGDGATTRDLDDAAQPRFAVLHREQFTIDFSWNVTAMRATGSNGIIVENAFVPDDLTAPLVAPPRIDRSLYRGHLPSIIVSGCSAVLLGVADRALEEVVSLIVSRRGADGVRMAENQHVQYLVAKSDAQLASARLLLHSAARSLQTSADGRESVGITQRARLRAAMSHTADVCTELFVNAYRLAGTSALYRSNRIEGLCRDGMALAQHGLHSARFLESAGRVRLGLEPTAPMF